MPCGRIAAKLSDKSSFRLSKPLTAITRGTGVLAFFGSRTPGAIPARHSWKTKVVAVLADGDLVTVATARTHPDPRNPAKTYTTTWFDMWRIKDGKADEHWDPATIPPPQK